MKFKKVIYRREQRKRFLIDLIMRSVCEADYAFVIRALIVAVSKSNNVNEYAILQYLDLQ